MTKPEQLQFYILFIKIKMEGSIMKLNRIIFFYIIFLSLSTICLAQNEYGPEVSFSGKIISAEDTGLGPFYGVVVEDDAKGQSQYFMVDIGTLYEKAPDGNWVGKYLNVKYKERYSKLINNLMLQSEFDTSASQAHCYVGGKYLWGEIGDMGSYITVVDYDGLEKNYKGTFEVEAENTEKYSGQQVIMYYEDDLENEVIDFDFVGDETNSIRGKVINVALGEKDRTFILTIENDNEIVDVIASEELIGGPNGFRTILGLSIEMEYSSETQRVLLSYSIESSALNEYNTSDEAIARFANLEKFSDEGRYVNNKIENGTVYLEIETAGGPIFENVLVYPGLGLEDGQKYQDLELLFTYVNEYKNTGKKLTVLD